MKPKPKQTMFFMALLLIGCSEIETPEEWSEDNTVNTEFNHAPVVEKQTFHLVENPPYGHSVGYITASDPDSPMLFYNATSKNAPAAFHIDQNTGQIVVTESSLIDYETASEVTLEVSVSDGVTSSLTSFAIQIEDADDGPLTNAEKDELHYMQELILKLGDELEEQDTVLKWTPDAHIYLDGHTYSYLNDIEYILNEIDDLTGDGFNIETTTDMNAANVLIYFGTYEDVNQRYPYFASFFNESKDGFAQWLSNKQDEIYQGIIWINTESEMINGTLRHEISHILGFGHSHKSGSIFNGELEVEHFSEEDTSLMRLLYSDDVYPGQSKEDLEETLTQILMTKRSG